MTNNNVRKRRNGPVSSPVRTVPMGAGTMVLRTARNLTVLALLVLLALMVSLSYNNTPPWRMSHSTNVLDRLAVRLGLQKELHAVVIDAGSTGTRVLAFTFHKSMLDGSLKLDRELFKEVKPGLSSYVKSPEEAAGPLQELLAAALLFVPAEDVSRTPLVLRATAGLRLLPEQRAEALLETARRVVGQSGFLTRPDTVQIMSGVDEGLFSWFTVNFLLDRLGEDPSYSVAVFDLGGGSTQVTFAPSDLNTVRQSPPGSIVDVSAMKEDLGVYTKSYLGVGLMAARHSLLTAGLPREQRSIVSPCINPIIKTTWSYAGKDYNISGVDTEKNYKFVKGLGGRIDKHEPIVNFVQCYESAVRFLSGQIHQPAELKLREVYGVSYYFDRASEAGLVDPFDGGALTVEQWMRAAREVCETPNVEQPFACLDMAYIAALLHHGLGLDGAHTIHMRKQIDGHETSWALGAAFHTLTNQA